MSSSINITNGKAATTLLTSVLQSAPTNIFLEISSSEVVILGTIMSLKVVLIAIGFDMFVKHYLY